MLVSVTVCLIGVAAGVALRIRSYVLLGSAILVACVLANVVHYGLIDHRLGAIFLSLLGLLVVGGMVLFTSHRAEWTRRYQEIRLQLSHWQA